MSRGNSNKLLVPGAQEALQQMKMEIARELGITLGADTSSRLNGTVGGEMVRRLVAMAQEQMSSRDEVRSKEKILRPSMKKEAMT